MTKSNLWNLSDITALVLAGGRGMRMGGLDKGLQHFNGTPLVQHALQRLASQQGGTFAHVVVNANRNLEDYRALAEAIFYPHPIQVIPDLCTEFAGPLAGFQAGLNICATPLMLTVPCDSPLFPLDLAQRLLHALLEADAEIAVAVAPEYGLAANTTLRSQPVFCLMRTCVVHALTAFLNADGRKADAWAAGLKRVEVTFNAPSDDPRAFANANTMGELRQLEHP